MAYDMNVDVASTSFIRDGYRQTMNAEDYAHSMVQEQTAVKSGISLNPDTYTEGALIDQANLLVKEARFVWWDYNSGGRLPTIPAAKLTLLADDDTEHEQYYSCGDAKNFAPSLDGTELIPVGNVTALNKTANFAILNQALIAAGFPKERITSKITYMEGLYAFWRRIKGPERTGLAPRTGPNADRDQTVLVVSTINNLPGEQSKRGTPAMAQAGGGGGVAAQPPVQAQPVGQVAPVNGAAAPAPNGVVSPASPVAEEAAGWLVTALMEPPFSMSKQDVSTKAFQALNGNPNRTAITTILYDDAFLAGLAGQGRIGYDAGTGIISRAG